jgi:aminobenzoyl-glutamate transport protein
MARLLDGIERVGNKIPNPAVLFLLLCVVIIVLSQVLFWWGVHATYETVAPPPVPTPAGLDASAVRGKAADERMLGGPAMTPPRLTAR